MSFMRKLLIGAALLLVLPACSAQNTPTPTVMPSDTVAPTVPPTRTPRPTRTSTPASAPEQAQAITLTAVISTPTITTPEAGITTTPPAGTAQSTLPAATQPPAGGSGAPDKYLYITQNVPDNTQVKPGQTFTVIWTVKNVGATQWTTDYVLRYFSGPTPSKTEYPFPQKVSSGQEVDLSLTITAPTVNGTYNSWWKLTNASNQNFGDVNIIFIVTDTPGEATPTP